MDTGDKFSDNREEDTPSTSRSTARRSLNGTSVSSNRGSKKSGQMERGSVTQHTTSVSNAMSRARSKKRQGRDDASDPGRSSSRSRSPVRRNSSRKGGKKSPDAPPPSSPSESVVAMATEEMELEIIESSQPPSPIQGDLFEEIDLDEEHRQAELLRDAIEAKLGARSDKLTKKKNVKNRKINTARGPTPPKVGDIDSFPESGVISVAATAAPVSSAATPRLEKLIQDARKSYCPTSPTASVSIGTSSARDGDEEDDDEEGVQPDPNELQLEFILPQDPQQKSFEFGPSQKPNPSAIGYDPNLLELAELSGEKALGGHFQVVRKVVAVAEENDGMKLLFGEVVVLDTNSQAGNELKFYQLALKPNQQVRISSSGKLQLELMEPRRLICRRTENGQSMIREVLSCQVLDPAQSEQKPHVLIPNPNPINIFQKGKVVVATTGKPQDDMRLNLQPH